MNIKDINEKLSRIGETNDRELWSDDVHDKEKTHGHLIDAGWKVIHTPRDNRNATIYIHPSFPNHIIQNGEGGITHSVFQGGMTSRQHGDSARRYIERL